MCGAAIDMLRCKLRNLHNNPMAKPAWEPYICCGAANCGANVWRTVMNGQRQLELWNDRLGFIFGLAMVAVVPLAAALMVIESL